MITSESLHEKFTPYLLLALAIIAAYANACSGAFVFDDNLLITLNQYLRSWSHIGDVLTASTTEGARINGGFYRPVQNLLYLLVYQMVGESPFAFHLLNILLHIANACLMYALGRRFGFNKWGVFFATLIWALHPLHTEAVTYISATADPLFTFFCLLGLLALFPDFSPGKFLAVTPLFLLALLSKETAIVFPLLAMIGLWRVDTQRRNPSFYDYRNSSVGDLHVKTQTERQKPLPQPRPHANERSSILELLSLYLRTWPLWMIAGFYLAWRLTAPGLDGPQSWERLYNQHDFYNLKLYAEHFSFRLYTFLAALSAYAKLLVWPFGLHMERSFSIFVSFWLGPVLAGFVIILAALGQVIWGHGRRGVPLSWGLLWFAMAHFPNTGLMVPVNSLLLEHWMYLPTIGLFLGIGETLCAVIVKQKPPKARLWFCLAASVIALLLGLRTHDQNKVWNDPITFYTNIFRYGEVSARASNNLAMAYMDAHEYQKARETFQRAVDITDTYAETRHNIAISLLNMPDSESHIPEAIENLKRAIEIDPSFYRSYGVLAAIYDHLGDSQKADYYKQKFIEARQKFEP